jgi:hypothetical protein
MTDKVDTTRRNLLYGALTAGAAATVAGQAEAAPETAPDPAQPADKRALHFEPTEHVRAYYRAARG